MAPKKSATKVVKTTKTVEQTIEVVSFPGSQSQQNRTQIQPELISERKEEQSSVTTTKSIPIQESDHDDDQDEEDTEITQDQDQPDLSTPPRKEAPPRVPEISETAEPKPKPENESGVDKKMRKRSKRRKGEGGYKRYVFRVLKQVHPGMGISSGAMIVINNFMNDMFERIAEEGSRINKQNKKITMSAREIQGAVKLVLPGELGKHAVAEGAKAVTNYVNFGSNKT